MVLTARINATHALAERYSQNWSVRKKVWNRYNHAPDKKKESALFQPIKTSLTIVRKWSPERDESGMTSQSYHFPVISHDDDWLVWDTVPEPTKGSPRNKPTKQSLDMDNHPTGCPLLSLSALLLSTVGASSIDEPHDRQKEDKRRCILHSVSHSLVCPSVSVSQTAGANVSTLISGTRQ